MNLTRRELGSFTLGSFFGFFYLAFFQKAKELSKPQIPEKSCVWTTDFPPGVKTVRTEWVTWNPIEKKNFIQVIVAGNDEMGRKYVMYDYYEGKLRNVQVMYSDMIWGEK